METQFRNITFINRPTEEDLKELKQYMEMYKDTLFRRNTLYDKVENISYKVKKGLTILGYLLSMAAFCFYTLSSYEKLSRGILLTTILFLLVLQFKQSKPSINDIVKAIIIDKKEEKEMLHILYYDDCRYEFTSAILNAENFISDHIDGRNSPKALKVEASLSYEKSSWNKLTITVAYAEEDGTITERKKALYVLNMKKNCHVTVPSYDVKNLTLIIPYEIEGNAGISEDMYEDWLNNMLAMLSKNYMDLVKASDEETLKSVMLPAPNETRKTIRLISEQTHPVPGMRVEPHMIEKFTKHFIKEQNKRVKE